MMPKSDPTLETVFEWLKGEYDAAVRLQRNNEHRPDMRPVYFNALGMSAAYNATMRKLPNLLAQWEQAIREDERRKVQEELAEEEAGLVPGEPHQSDCLCDDCEGGRMRRQPNETRRAYKARMKR